jgi:mannose-1-phosphate guanylyltransferase
VLLGMRPRRADEEYGWIVPEPGRRALRRVLAFVEKPEPPLARRLLEEGALWNSFLFAVEAAALDWLYARHLPGLHAAFHAAFARPERTRRAAVDGLYAACERHDFSRSLLQAAPGALKVLETPECGWTDLGTPARLRECLRGLAEPPGAESRPRWLDLARAAAEASWT